LGRARRADLPEQGRDRQRGAERSPHRHSSGRAASAPPRGGAAPKDNRTVAL
jgi:hypothetical protein